MSQDQDDSPRLTGVVDVRGTSVGTPCASHPGRPVSPAPAAYWSQIWSQPGALLPLPRLPCHPVDLAQPDRADTRGQPSTQPPPAFPGVQEHHGVAAAKTTRTVLSGMIGLAVRYDALERNPVREVGRIESERSSARALSVGEATELRGRLHGDERCQAWDLIDFTDFMLATGLRIGEASAITWDTLDLDAGTVAVRGTVVRLKGFGLTIKQPKSTSGVRTLELPGWAVAMLHRRREQARANERGVVFTAPSGGLRDPSNTQADLRVVFTAAGYGWVTSHIYRKTVATLMDEAGLSARQAADQLGHAKVSMTQDNYFGRRVARTGAAGLLEVFGGATQSPRISRGIPGASGADERLSGR